MKACYKSLNVQHKISSVGLSLCLSLSVYLSLSQNAYVSLWEDRDIYSFHIPFSVNFYHSRIRHLEITFSCSLSFSLSLWFFPNTHHICVDSQLARSIWTVTVLGSNSGFLIICLIDYSLRFFFFFSLWVECEVLCHHSLSAGWKKQSDTVVVVGLWLV